jgi:hypothetical protein
MARAAEDLEREARQREKSGRGDAAFRKHLAVFLAVGLFLFTLNLLTSPTDLWFYWPLFFWGWALVIQAAATFGTEAPARVMEELRALVPGMPKSMPVRGGRSRSFGKRPFAAEEFASLHERIEQLKALAIQLPTGPVRGYAERIAATAERSAAAMAADRAGAETVAWFATQLLQPTERLLGRYVLLTSRGVTGAEETLKRVEEQNLPLLASRFDALYNQIHRGDIIDLAVASEMLEFDPPELPPAFQRAQS